MRTMLSRSIHLYPSSLELQRIYCVCVIQHTNSLSEFKISALFISLSLSRALSLSFSLSLACSFSLSPSLSACLIRGPTNRRAKYQTRQPSQHGFFRYPIPNHTLLCITLNTSPESQNGSFRHCPNHCILNPLGDVTSKSHPRQNCMKRARPVQTANQKLRRGSRAIMACSGMTLLNHTLLFVSLDTGLQTPLSIPPEPGALRCRMTGVSLHTGLYPQMNPESPTLNRFVSAMTLSVR